MQHEPDPIRPHVTVIDDIRNIDLNLPGGQLLIEYYPDGQVHVAYRHFRHDTWSAGVWTVDNTPTT